MHLMVSPFHHFLECTHITRTHVYMRTIWAAKLLKIFGTHKFFDEIIKFI